MRTRNHIMYTGTSMSVQCKWTHGTEPLNYVLHKAQHPQSPTPYSLSPIHDHENSRNANFLCSGDLVRTIKHNISRVHLLTIPTGEKWSKKSWKWPHQTSITEPKTLSDASTEVMCELRTVPRGPAHERVLAGKGIIIERRLKETEIFSFQNSTVEREKLTKLATKASLRRLRSAGSIEAVTLHQQRKASMSVTRLKKMEVAFLFHFLCSATSCIYKGLPNRSS